MSIFSKRLKKLREEHDLSQQALANALKISKSSINMYERGEREPGFETLEAIADYFNVDMNYLLGRTAINPDIYLSNDLQTDLFQLFDQNCKQRNISCAMAIARSSVIYNFFPRLKIGKLHSANLHDLVSVAEYLGIKEKVEDLLKAAIPLTESSHLSPLPKMKQWKVLGGTACGEPIFKEPEDESVLAPASIDADFVFRCVGDSMINARIFDGDIVFVKSGVEVESGQIAVVRIGEEYTLKRIYRGEDYLELRVENPMYPARIIRGEQENAEIVGKAVQFLSRVI